MSATRGSGTRDNISLYTWVGVAVGAVGLIFAGLGWNNNAAAPALLAGGNAMIVFWSFVIKQFARIAIEKKSPLFTPAGIKAFQAVGIVCEFVFLVSGVAVFIGESNTVSRWLVPSILTIVLGEFTLFASYLSSSGGFNHLRAMRNGNVTGVANQSNSGFEDSP